MTLGLQVAFPDPEQYDGVRREDSSQLEATQLQIVLEGRGDKKKKRISWRVQGENCCVNIFPNI